MQLLSRELKKAGSPAPIASAAVDPDVVAPAAVVPPRCHLLFLLPSILLILNELVNKHGDEEVGRYEEANHKSAEEEDRCSEGGGDAPRRKEATRPISREYGSDG